MKPQRYLAILPAAMLAFGVSARPYGYYDLMRVVVFFGAASIALTSSTEGIRATSRGIVFALIALTFNPFWPFHFVRGMWQYIDAGSAGVFAVFALSGLICSRAIGSSDREKRIRIAKEIPSTSNADNPVRGATTKRVPAARPQSRPVLPAKRTEKWLQLWVCRTLGVLVLAGVIKLMWQDSNQGQPSQAAAQVVKPSQPAAHNGDVTSIAFSHDGKFLASGSADKTIKLWALPDGKLEATMVGHGDTVNSFAFSPDGNMLASASGDKTIKLWALPDGKFEKTLKGHTDSVEVIAFSHDGKLLVSASDDKTIRVWAMPDGTPIATLALQGKSIDSLAFSPDGKVLAASLENDIMLWSLPDGKLLATLKGHDYQVVTIAFSPDGQMLASGSEDGTIKTWSIPTGRLLVSWQGHNEFAELPLSVAFDQAGMLLASGSLISRDTTIKVWSPPKGVQIASLNPHGDFIDCIAFSPDAKMLASGGGAGSITVWELGGPHRHWQFFDPALQ